MEKPLRDEQALYARSTAVLILNLDPDIPRAREIYDWTEERLEESQLRCRRLVEDAEFREAMIPCGLAVQLAPSDTRSRDHLAFSSRYAHRQERNRVVFRYLLLAGVGLLCLVGFLFMQGEVFRMVGRRELALASMHYMQALVPRWKRPYLAIADIRREQGRLDLERRMLERASERWPAHRTVLRAMLEFHIRQDDERGVRGALLALIEGGANDGDLPDLVALAMEASAPIEERLVERLERHLERIPDSPIVALLAKAYAQRGRQDQAAIEIYDRALALGTRLGDARLKALLPNSRLLLENGDPDGALSLAREALVFDGSPEAIACWTEALMRSEFEEHVAMEGTPPGGAMVLVPLLVRSLEESPQHAQLVRDRLSTLLETNDDAQEAAVLAALQHIIDGADCREMLASVAEATDRKPSYWAAAEAVFRIYSKEHPNDYALPFQMADIHRWLGRPERALAILADVARVQASNSLALKRTANLVQEYDLVTVVQLGLSLMGVESRLIDISPWGWAELGLRAVGDDAFAWWPEFKGARFRVFESRAPLPRDLTDFVDSLEKRDGDDQRLGIIVSAGRPSATVLNMVLGLMIEKPGLQLVPLWERQLRDAVAELRFEKLLSQLRSQWLLGEDLFDNKNPIKSDAGFFGRGSVLRSLAAKFNRGEVFGLFGLRKIGKTSLAFRLRDQIADAVVSFVDLQAHSSRSCADLARELCAQSLDDWRSKFHDKPAPPDLVPVPEDVPGAIHALEINIRRLRETILASMEIKSLVFLMDEIELMIPHPRDDGTYYEGFKGYDDFFRMLRGLHQSDADGIFSFAVIGADARLCLDGKWGGRDNPVFQYFAEVYLAPFEPEECSELVTSLGMGMGISFTDGALDQQYHYSGGHPMISRQLCSAAVAALEGKRPAVISSAAIVEAAEDYLSQESGYLSQILDSYLSASQRSLLYVLAGNESELMTRSVISAELVEEGASLSQVNKDLEVLENFSVLCRRGDQYHIPMRLLRLYLRFHRLGLED